MLVSPPQLKGVLVRDVAVDVAHVTGKRPNGMLTSLLDDWLLPREMILSGVAGTEGLDRIFLLLTPLNVLILREGRQCRVTPLAFTEWTGWELRPSWSGPAFVLATHHGLVELKSVDATRAQQFVFATEHHMTNSVAPDGMFGPGAVIAGAFDTLAAAVMTARGAGPAQEQEVGHLTAVHGARMLAGATRAAGALTLEMAWALLALQQMAEPTRSAGPGAAVRSLLAAPAPPFDPATCELFTRGSGQDRRAVLIAAQELVRAFSAGVPLQNREAMAVFARLTQQLHDLAAPVPQLAGEAHGGHRPALRADGDVLAQLERLATLHASGALTEEEFAGLKGRLLAAGG